MKPKRPAALANTPTGAVEVDVHTLVTDVRQLIDSSRAQLAGVVNSALTLLYWKIGRRINGEVLKGERAGYGEQIVLTLSRQLEPNAAGVSAARTCDICCVLPKPLRSWILSRRCQDNWRGAIFWNSLPERPAQTRFLRRHVCSGALERAHPAEAHGHHAVRAHRVVPQAR